MRRGISWTTLILVPVFLFFVVGILRVSGPASTIDTPTIWGGLAGSSHQASIVAAGMDTDIHLDLLPTGAGVVKIKPTPGCLDAAPVVTAGIVTHC